LLGSLPGFFVPIEYIGTQNDNAWTIFDFFSNLLK